MKLTKNGMILELDNPIQIEAFRSSGYTEVREPETAPKPEVKPKTTRKKKD